MNLKEILTNTPNLNTVEPIGTDKNASHCYIDCFYDEEFAGLQDKQINFLEIGINTGGSLYLWGKYFKNATIYGIDIQDKILENWKGLSNVNYLIKNAYTQEVADSLPNFDIIIDDGPHTLDSQINAIKFYLPKLKDKGIFIIEDVQRVDWFKTLIDNTPAEYQNKISTINLTHVRNRWDDLLFVIRK